MGVGKTTFARALLAGLGLNQPAEGSPTFAIAHEYDTPAGSVVHMDFYRLKSEMEIDDAGIPSYFWDRDLIVITEWLSSWPEFEALVMRSGRVFRVELEHPQNPEKIMSPENLRTIQIFQMNSSS
jgi:tRNA threonylcarbamoyladenosine biosynthesis protein TsaE